MKYTDEQRAEIKKWSQSLYWHLMGGEPDDAKTKACIDELTAWASKKPVDKT